MCPNILVVLFLIWLGCSGLYLAIKINWFHFTHLKVMMEKATRTAIKSSERVLVYADGELLGEGPASFWLVPSALSIVV